MLDDARWWETSVLIDEACGLAGSHLVIVGGHSHDAAEWLFDKAYCGELREEQARDYVENYFPRDERIPRMFRLPDRRVVHVTDLFTEPELKTSPTYNELLRRSDAQNGLNIRMDGPSGLHVVWALADPTEPDGWSSEQIEMIERLLPHIRQFVRVRQALVGAQALGASLAATCSGSTLGLAPGSTISTSAATPPTPKPAWCTATGVACSANGGRTGDRSTVIEPPAAWTATWSWPGKRGRTTGKRKAAGTRNAGTEDATAGFTDMLLMFDRTAPPTADQRQPHCAMNKESESGVTSRLLAQQLDTAGPTHARGRPEAHGELDLPASRRRTVLREPPAHELPAGPRGPSAESAAAPSEVGEDAHAAPPRSKNRLPRLISKTDCWASGRDDHGRKPAMRAARRRARGRLR